MSEILVIGYGNTLRGDDAAGIRAAELLGKSIDDIDVILVPDLSLELARPMSQCEHVIFVDACADGSSVRLENLTPGSLPGTISTHTNSPWTLVEACRTIYGHIPRRTILATIPGERFDLSETLSDNTAVYVQECVTILQQEILKLRQPPEGGSERPL
jgi:hydrogenase maturation protease